MKTIKPNPYNLKPSKGMTLIETLIYAALVSIVIGMIVVVAFQVMQGSSNLGDKIFLEEEANFILKKIEWIISGASIINSPDPGDSSNSAFSVDKFGFSGAENPVAFGVSDGEISIQRGGGLPITLNSSFVTVENATFTHIAATGTVPAGIIVELSIKTSGSPSGRQYETKTYLRN